MHEPMSAPLIVAGPNGTGSGPASASAQLSQSPCYHSSAPSPSSSSISSPVSSTSSSGNSSASSSSSSSILSSSAPSPPHPSAIMVSNGGAPVLETIQQHKQTPINTKQELFTGKQRTLSIGANQNATTRQNQSGNNQNNNNNGVNIFSSLFDLLPGLNYDGAMMTWFHAANSRASLSSAISSNKLFVSGDISLAEMSRYPVPIMARPPLGASDLTLENWLTDMTKSHKGIKLTFTSTRTVEPAFRVLARHAEQIKGPLILSADILARPSSAGVQPESRQNSQSQVQKQSQQQHQHQPQAQANQPVDAWTFLMLCRTRFPRSIISIGWCSAAGSSVSAQDSASTQLALSPPASVDSLFEIDIDNHHQMQQQSSKQGALPMRAPFLDEASAQQHALMQRLAAAAAAQVHSHHSHLLPPAAFIASQNLPNSPAQLHRGASLSIRQNFNHHHHHHHHQRGNHHKHLSSSGSLSSNSSGNSSGSPSPTSPLSHHSAHHQHAHLGAPYRHHSSESPEQQLIMAAAAAAAASQQADNQRQPSDGAPVDWPAAVAAAAMVAASSFQQQQQQPQLQDNQMPLNLNINEADPKHTSNHLNELTQRIQSMRQCVNSLSPAITTTTMNINRIQQQQQQQQQHPKNNQHLVLANKLISGSRQQLITSSGADLIGSNGWHVNKKAAISSCLDSNSPSPVSTSPRQQQQQQQQQHKATNLLCVSKTQDQQQVAKQQSSSNRSDSCGGYTREMIDKMASLVKEYNLTQPITFPVDARLLLRDDNSLNELQRLLYQVGSNSTLTIVAQQEDLIGVDDLLQMRKHFSPQQIIFDLPDDLAAALRQESDPV